MRTTDDLANAFALLEREAEHYLEFSGLRADVPKRTTHRVLAAAVAAVVTLGVAIAAATLYTVSDRAPTTGATNSVCVTSLPPAWRQAFHDQIEVPGSNPQPLAITDKGAVVTAWTDADGNLRFGRLRADAPPLQLARVPVPRGWQPTQLTATDRYAVVPFFAHGHTAAVDLIDLANGRRTSLLPHAPLGRHAQISPGSWVALQHGTVYWPASRPGSNAPNVLISYNIAHRSYAHTQKSGPAVFANPLGIYWQDGHLVAQQLPPMHPAIDRRMTVATDRDALAWSFGDGSMVYWSDLPGDSRTLSQNLSHFIGIDAVAGPYVFLDRGEGDDSDSMSGNAHVLDTRTGALADLHLETGWYPVASRDGLVAFNIGEPGSTFHVVDTTKLPELRCS